VLVERSSLGPYGCVDSQAGPRGMDWARLAKPSNDCSTPGLSDRLVTAQLWLRRVVNSYVSQVSTALGRVLLTSERPVVRNRLRPPRSQTSGPILEARFRPKGSAFSGPFPSASRSGAVNTCGPACQALFPPAVLLTTLTALIFAAVSAGSSPRPGPQPVRQTPGDQRR
jgi:hypothetical protein